MSTLFSGAPAALAALILAPFVGSFLALLADRLPRGEPVVHDRSRCRSCARPLRPRDMVPLLSWALLRGRCAGCGAGIPWELPAMEAAALLLAGWAAAVVPAALVWPTAALGWVLLALAAIDARCFWLPDRLTLPLAAAGLGVNSWLAGGWPLGAMAGCGLGWAVFAGLILGYRRLRGRDGMGWGDARLLAAGGAWTGWEGLPGIVLIAALAALAAALALGHRGGDARVPFGPALALGIWITWLHGPLLLGGG